MGPVLVQAYVEARQTLCQTLNSYELASWLILHPRADQVGDIYYTPRARYITPPGYIRRRAASGASWLQLQLQPPQLQLQAKDQTPEDFKSENTLALLQIPYPAVATLYRADVGEKKMRPRR